MIYDFNSENMIYMIINHNIVYLFIIYYLSIKILHKFQLLNKSESRKRVKQDKRYLINESKKRDLIKELVQLAGIDKDLSIENFITYVQDRGAFTPNQMALLYWRFKKSNIAINSSLYKIVIKRNREKYQLLEMEDWKVKEIWSILTQSQKTWYSKNKR